MAPRAELKQTTINRYASLKEHFGDRFFNVSQAAEFLGIAKGMTQDLMRALLAKKMVVKAKPPTGPAEYKIACFAKTLADAAAESLRLREAAETGATEPYVSRMPAYAGKEPPAASSLPATLVIDGIKYVRMDKIAEVILDQL